MEFETLLKIVVALLAAFGIPVAAYAAIVATRAIWVKGEPNSIAAALQDRVDMLEARVAELESGQERSRSWRNGWISPSGCWRARSRTGCRDSRCFRYSAGGGRIRLQVQPWSQVW